MAPHLTIHLDNNTVTDQRNQTSVFVPHGNGESISKRKNVRDCINTVAGVVGAFSTGAGAAAAWYDTFHKDLPGEIINKLSALCPIFVSPWFSIPALIYPNTNQTAAELKQVVIVPTDPPTKFLIAVMKFVPQDAAAIVPAAFADLANKSSPPPT